MSAARVLVAGIGNIFLGDDAFGVEVARRLIARPQPPSVQVVDFGIRALDLIYALTDGCDTAILIDALPRGQAPGTLYVLEPRVDEPAGSPIAMDGHSMDPVKVLQAAQSMGTAPQEVLIVGCEPKPTSEDEMEMTLSPAVAAAVNEAVEIVESLVAQALKHESQTMEVSTWSH